ncbi:Na(+)/H(+) antiporter subunit G [Rossellomorea marisflavi]|uniref:monovalent cation/H(+) antiporter subunit G n=1 Tax=Rossellomorea marisflavi TaxID=189381 RepID=UPI0025CA6D6D|nr:monovalent cation/H(+) antiporter subunit G [Rossellomorea marisflavi]UTE73932.1 monovalent cation/H(+) antiporter subunit G [Rossellomorea marisflavi]GLI85259.1 Na(+)/H(+) antiporter subunit G [Rossellomorea marisflavi]
MTEIVNYIIGFFLLAGGFLSLVASFGVLRLPDIYTRNHAASKSATLGIMCILLGTFLYFYIVHGIFNSKVLLAIVFIFVTAPVGGHLIARAAYHSGAKLWDKSIRDDLKEKEKYDRQHP